MSLLNPVHNVEVRLLCSLFPYFSLSPLHSTVVREFNWTAVLLHRNRKET